jgi:hypothetical protein
VRVTHQTREVRDFNDWVIDSGMPVSIALITIVLGELRLARFRCIVDDMD